MGDTPTTPAAPAGLTGAEVEAIVKRTLAAALPLAVTEAVKPLAEQLGQIKPLADQVKGLQDGLGKAATPEAVAQAVQAQLAAQAATQGKADARRAFLTEKMKDIPDAYHSGIGDDPAKFAEQEQQIRSVFRTDLTKLGVKVDNLGGNTASGTSGGGNPQKVTAAVDTSKLSGIELIQMGVQQTTPAPGSGSTATATTTATTTTTTPKA